MSSPAHALKVHYHIQWSGSPELDWQAFESPDEAEAVAKYLARKDESYTIEAVTGDCKRCAQAFEDSLRRNIAAYNRNKASRD